MISPAEIVCDYLEKTVTDDAKNALPFRLEVELFANADTDSACIRHDPAPAAEKRFIDGSRIVQWNLSLFVRAKDAREGLKWARLMTDALDGARIEDDAGAVDCETTALPQFVETDEAGFTIYMSSVSARYYMDSDTEVEE